MKGPSSAIAAGLLNSMDECSRHNLAAHPERKREMASVLLFQEYSFFTRVVAGVVPVLSCKQPSNGLLGLAEGY
jgi:hypothetical protein